MTIVTCIAENTDVLSMVNMQDIIIYSMHDR